MKSFQWSNSRVIAVGAIHRVSASVNFVAIDFVQTRYIVSTMIVHENGEMVLAWCRPLPVNEPANLRVRHRAGRSVPESASASALPNMQPTKWPLGLMTGVPGHTMTQSDHQKVYPFSRNAVRRA